MEFRKEWFKVRNVISDLIFLEMGEWVLYLKYFLKNILYVELKFEKIVGLRKIGKLFLRVRIFNNNVLGNWKMIRVWKYDFFIEIFEYLSVWFRVNI